jgi:hypothetical protein
MPQNIVARGSFSQTQEIKKPKPIMAYMLAPAAAMKNRVFSMISLPNDL